ncbi:hypothetical protein [uncultured Treponema sp.]|uniref:hypothetical protein n=1 Tax=uncultured Treponema sp. TaxID=162155 RepID=UPI002599ABCA|nr:hypothetical protein [uncultured Treponema sp.]
MKKFISLLGLLLIASAVFAQSFTLKTADKTPCTITLNGDFIVIEETLLGGYINRITIPKSQFTSTKAKIDSEQGGKSVINNKPFMESGDVIYIMEDQKNSSIVGFLSGRAVYQQNPVLGIWLYKKDIAAIAKKLKL